MTFRISVSGWLPMGRYRVPSSAPHETEDTLLREKGAAARSHATVSAAGRTHGAHSARQAAKLRLATTTTGSQNPSLIAVRCATAEGATGKKGSGLTP